VFVLDMGEPVRISDLARHMITLSGMTVRDEDNPDGDVAIEYIGLRPGEKLFEELFIGEDTVETAHPRIKMARERWMRMTELQSHLDGLKHAIAAADEGLVRAKLHELVAPDLASSTADVERAECPQAAE
jgi:FlaA1/EpsC-like NDP-sugar epimerase